MTLYDFWKSLPKTEKERFAKRCGTSTGYLRLVAAGHARAGVAAAIRYCKASNWQVTPHEMRPDVYPTPLDGMSHKTAA